MSAVDKKKLVIYTPDTRGVTVSPYGKGNMKIGLECFTFSRLPGLPTALALGEEKKTFPLHHGTCPGATEECLSICYARRPVEEQGAVYEMWTRNSNTEYVPPIPDECKYLRIHVSGDFSSVEYIQNWIHRLTERPDVKAWAYTRSWRVPEFARALKDLHDLPNIQLFASMDPSTRELPPAGWRRAWIEGDHRLHPRTEYTQRAITTPSLICPEETKRRANCIECGYCLIGNKSDVTFIRH
jgi:hypothetical protein